MKYIKPNSLTWWCSFAPVCAGLFIATLPIHGLNAWVASLDAITGGLEPAVLINAGLVGIGMRGAL